MTAKGTTNGTKFTIRDLVENGSSRSVPVHTDESSVAETAKADWRKVAIAWAISE